MRELVESVEAWDLTSGDPTFHHTAIIWKEGDNYYQFNHPERTKSFNLDSLPATTPIFSRALGMHLLLNYLLWLPQTLF